MLLGVYRGLAELTQLQLISANGADVAATATPAAAGKKTAIGPIIGGTHATPPQGHATHVPQSLY